MDRSKLQEIVSGQVERLFNEQLEFLSNLVAFQSLTGKEGPGQEFYGRACKALGMDVEFFEAQKDHIKAHPG